MEFQIEKGIKHTEEKVVHYKDTAANYGSGLVEVFATPAMIALMENTALKTVQPYLPEKYNTVGFELNIRHLKPTPIGETVKCTATLTKSEGKKLVFHVQAEDKDGKIGEGTHIRYIINTDKFMQQFK
jgi:predicted thioesterase